MKLDQAVAASPVKFATLTASDKYAYLSETTKTPNNEPYNYQSTRIGYMAPSGDTTAAAATLETNPGHVFGRLGQGELAMPGKSEPFLWFT